MIFFRASAAFSLGLERTGGFETVAFCEIEDYPRRVLAKHWPKVPIYHDVRELTADTLRRDGIAVDVICGGFPCQDISFAGKGAGIAGERSGLWREYARLVRELRPRFVIVENVAALLGRGLADVLGDLAAIGYDAEWHCIPASAVGAPHRRDRLWIVAYPDAREQPAWAISPIRRRASAQEKGASDATNADADRVRKLQPGWCFFYVWRRPVHGNQGWMGWAGDWRDRLGAFCGMDDGLSRRLDEAKPCGNAVVPQIPQLIGQAILQAEGLTP